MAHPVPVDHKGEVAMERFMDDLPEERRRALERMLRPPDEPWPSGGASARGLAFELHVEVDTFQLKTDPRLQPLSALFPAKSSRSRLEVVLGSGRRRVETSSDDGLHPRGYVQVSDEGAGTLHVDHDSRTFLHMPPGTLPGAPVEPSHFTLHVEGEGLLGGRQVRNVRLSSLHPLDITWQLAMCADEDLRDFADDVLCLAVGCRGHLEELGVPVLDLLVHGVPIAGRVLTHHAQGRSGEPRTVSSFRLDRIKLRKVANHEFDVPTGYADLRSQQAGPPRAERVSR